MQKLQIFARKKAKKGVKNGFPARCCIQAAQGAIHLYCVTKYIIGFQKNRNEIVWPRRDWLIKSGKHEFGQWERAEQFLCSQHTA